MPDVGQRPGGRGGVPRRLVRTLANLVYRDIDVHLPIEPIPDGPVLAVSNHFGGLSDGVLLIDSLPRMPRVVARDVIWRVPVVGSLASAIGMIPVHRAADGTRASNDETFASAYEALGSGDLVLIFPEGVTQDVPYMAQVRTGAARIVLGARESGVAGIHVLPIGLHYEDKAGFRSRALVNVGAPIALDEWVDSHPGGVSGGADDRAAVRDLTATIDAALRRTAPDFPDWPTAEALSTAAEVLLNDVDRAPTEPTQYGDVELLAARINRSDPGATQPLVASATAYRTALRRAGTADRSVASGGARRRSWSWLADSAIAVLLLPYALLGLLIAVIPLLLVAIATRLPIAPAVRATAVPGIAMLTFFGEWLLFAWQSLFDDGLEYGLAAVMLFPFFVGALFLVHERVILLWRRWRTRKRPGRTDLPALEVLRSDVSERGWASL